MKNLITMALIMMVAGPVPAGELSLWSDKPAAEWVEAYPIGNGAFGAMVFGGVNRERIQFNHIRCSPASPTTMRTKAQ